MLKTSGKHTKKNFHSHQRNHNSIESEAKLWKKIVRFCTENHCRFVDDSFPPCDKSLYIDYKTTRPDRPLVKWLRPEQIRVHQPSEKSLEWTVLNEPRFSDIKQGLLGNCWLLSGLVVILEKLELLERILVSTEYSPHGCYPLRLCHNGEWKLVIVDDLLPCQMHSARPIYSQVVRKQLWVSLVEKAMAKLNGSYESLVAGQTVEALSTLTGYPCESIRLEDDGFNDQYDLIWTRLLSMKEAGYVLAASCGRSSIDDDKVFSSCGLLPRHAYSILNIKEVLGNQLIQLRNPWGRYSWTGDWCETSSKWTLDVRQALEDALARTSPKHAKQMTPWTSTRGGKDEGIFWMSFVDFVQYFSSIDICKTRLDWFERRLTGMFARENAKKIQAFHLVVFETCLLDIELFHKTNKTRRETSNLLDLCFVVLDYRTRVFVAASKRSIKKFIQLESMFEPGEYLIIPISVNVWNYDVHQEDFMYNLVVHGPDPFFLESNLYSINLQAEAIIELCVHLGQCDESGMEGVRIYTLSKGYSGLVVVAENLSHTAYFHVELDCMTSTNVRSSRLLHDEAAHTGGGGGALITLDSVPPRARHCLTMLTQIEPQKSYAVHYSVKCRLSSNPFLNTWPGNEGIYCTSRPRVEFGLHAPQSIRYFITST